MARRFASVLSDLKLVRSKDVAQWYGGVVTAWDSLQPPLPDGRTTHWRNLGYWTPQTATLDEACRALATRLADAADVRAGQEVLDVGCGLGESTFLLDRRLRGDGGRRSRLVGLDLTPEHLAHAVARRDGPAPEFVVGSATRLPFPDGSFDRVLALECAFHFPDRRQFFDQAYRTLRPGGVLGVADVLVRPWFSRVLRVTDRVVPTRPRTAMHELAGDILKMPTQNLVDLAQYLRQVRAAGFRIRGVEDISDRVFPYFMRHWRQAQDHARQEQALTAAGVDPADAGELARAWRRQMRVLMLGWHSSRFVIVTAERPSAPGTGEVVR